MEQSPETRVLGAALSEPGLWLSQADRIHPDLFTDFAALASMLCAMRDAGHSIDVRSAQAWAQDHNQAMRIGDLLEIAEHSPMSPTSMTAAVDALHEQAKRRALVKLGRALTETAANKRYRADDILAESLTKLTDIGARSARALEPIGAGLQRVIKDLGKPLSNAVKTGLGAVDRVTSGFKPGQLIVLGARPSMGKTAFAVGVARQAALAGKSVAYFSLEMSADEVIHRMLANLSDVDLTRISTHNLREQDLTAILAAANRLHESRVFIAESTNQIEGVCAQAKHQHGLDLVVVDYLQLMSCRAESREQQIATLSRALKRLARAVRCPVLVLSQLNRALEARANKRPQLSDLRESGAIEQDADVVLFLWREGYYSPESPQDTAELVVAKHRNGPTGTVPLTWDETRARFTQSKTP